MKLNHNIHTLTYTFKLIMMHNNTQKQKKRKFEPRIKFNHNIYHWEDLKQSSAK